MARGSLPSSPLGIVSSPARGSSGGRKRRAPPAARVACAAGLNVRMLQYYEQGAKDLNGAKLATLLKLCLALDCQLGDILTDEETVKLLERYTAA